MPGAANQANIAVSGTYTVTSSQGNAAESLNIADSKATLAITNRSPSRWGPSSVNGGTIAIGAGSQLLAGGVITNTNVIESVNANFTSPALIENGTVDNSGVLEATGLTALELGNVTVDNLFPAATRPEP